MKKKIQKMTGFCLTIMLLLSMPVSAYAESLLPELGKTVEGSTLVADNSSEVTIYSRTRGNILNRGVARVSDNGDGSVNAYGAVHAAVICDTLELTLLVQRYNGSTWSDVARRSYSASNAGILSRSFDISVTKGYYYRVKAACVAKDGGAIESQMPVTNGVWVD